MTHWIGWPRIARLSATLALALACAAVPRAATAGPRLADVGGRLTLGYGHLFAEEAPGGSLSVGIGLDLPVADALHAGLGVGYHLLGSRTLVQGSLSSGLEYSLFEALALLHWTPGTGGPAIELSAGPGLFIAHADLASSPIGATFSSQAIGETLVGAAFGVTVSPRRTGPVRAGIEAGVRVVPLDPDLWTIGLVRLALHY